MNKELFISLGFEATQKNKQTIWTGSFNLTVESIGYLKKTDNYSVILHETQKISDRKKIGEYQIKGTLFLEFLQLEAFSIESTSQFQFFKRKTKLSDYYTLLGEHEPFLTTNGVQEILMELIDFEVMISGEKNEVKFDFHLDENDIRSIASIIKLIELIAS